MKGDETPSEHVTPAKVRQWAADGVPVTEIDRRTLADHITSDELRKWFDQIPGCSGPWPSGAALEQLARDIDHFRMAGWPHALSEKQAERFRRVIAAGEELAAAIEAWLDIQAIDPRSDAYSQHTFARVAESLLQGGFVATDRPAQPTPRARGQPRAEWHRWAREFVLLLKPALKEAGYKGGLTATNAESALAIIGAAYVHRCFGLEISPEGFATAMKKRDRRKGATKAGASIDELFPQVARFPVSDTGKRT